MPQTLGKYEILEPLGSGGYAQVYLARDTELGRQVALKVLHQAHLLDENALARFRREGQVLAGLVHPHIAFAWEFGQADGRVYIATRYVPGPSLDKMLASGNALAWKQAQVILEQIGSALDFAHRKGIIHRDVKPANILVGEDDGGVLTDFGLVKALQSSGLTTTNSAFMGTPAYIPPEIWLGEESTAASDQYALACVAGEMLGGKVLFPGDTPPAIMTRHVMSGPVLPARWPQGTPEGIKTILEKALSRMPGERFASVKEFVLALQAISASALVSQHQSQKDKGGASPLPLIHSAEAQVRVSIDSAPDRLGFEWIEIPAGELLYGDEKQQVIISKPFLISKFPVTQAQYQLFITANPQHSVPDDWNAQTRRHPQGKERHPVVAVSWHDVQAFCRWASQALGVDVRLHSEQEWEKAARGTDGRKYPWGETWVNGKYANSKEAGVAGTTPVSNYPLGVSPYGVWDMSGNTWEWTASFHKDGVYRVLRGGAWFNRESNLCSANRTWRSPDSSYEDVGFRCVRSA